MKINGMLSASEFVQNIEKMCKEKEMEYIDAVLHYCTEHNIEIETAAGMIKMSGPMKSKIQAEAESLNFLPKTSKLPI
jgi:hypothetical protein